MKKLYNLTLLIAFVTLFSVTGNSQVVMKDYLVANHQGVVEKSLNNNGSGLFYKFEYVSTEGASRVKYSPHVGCLRVDPPVYERYTIGAETESAEVLFAGLLNNFIAQLDKNVDFNCYAAAK